MMKIIHLREPNNNFVIHDNKLLLDKRGKPRKHKGKIYATVILDGKNIGVSKVGPEDKFSKKLGVQIAKGRLSSHHPVPISLKKEITAIVSQYGAHMPKFQEPQSREIDWIDIENGTMIRVKENWYDYQFQLDAVGIDRDHFEPTLEPFHFDKNLYFRNSEVFFGRDDDYFKFGVHCPICIFELA